MLFGVLNVNSFTPEPKNSVGALPEKPKSAEASREDDKPTVKRPLSCNEGCCLVSCSPCICLLASFCGLLRYCQLKCGFDKSADKKNA